MKLKSIMRYLLAAAALFAGSSAFAVEQLPVGAKLVKVEARPSAIDLKHRYDYAQLLLTGTLENGEQLDVTRMAQVETSTSAVSLSPAMLVRPTSDGAGEIKASLAGLSLVVPVTVSGQTADYPVSFVKDVMPMLSKLGCNAGTCHGAQDGKNGFKLSLRGYDPLFDFRALTDDLAGRRFNRAAPDHSLMLLKPAGGVPHVGGVLTKSGEPGYELLRAWIAGGVKLDLDSPRVTSIELFPQNPVIPLAGMTQQIAVMATYSDGQQRDVTAEAFVETSLAEVVEADKHGLMTAVRRGEAAILARFEGSYAATTITVMGDRSGFEWKDIPENNYIDTLVHKKLRQVKVLPSGLCSDSEFVRRIYLDLIGLPPSPDVVMAFLSDPRETRVKRDELIDRLIGSTEYVEYWTNKWADMLSVNRKFLAEKGTWALRNWIRQAVASNMPYDKLAYAVLTGSGSTFENPPAAYYRVLREPDAAVENTTQLFLSVRFSCNKCHDHPFERWTQTQYYQLGAYFAQIGRKPGPNTEEEVIYDIGSGDVTHARTGVLTPPEFPYQHDDLAPAGSTRREQLAHWVVSPKNQYFAKGYVNRLWSYLLGVGFIEPVDDVRAGNPASNPELLDKLTEEFIASGFNIQETIRTICKSRTYQNGIETNQWNADDTINYSHALARRLPAETLYDAVHRVTGSVERLPGLPVGFRASQLPDSSTQLPDGFLDLFGRPPRESACECERAGGVILGQALNLVNGPTIANAIADPNNNIARLVATESDDAKLINALFVSILARPATEKEIAAGLGALQGAAEEGQRYIAELAKYEQEVLPGKLAEWLKSAGQKPAWGVLTADEPQSAGGAAFAKQEDGSLLLSGNNPPSDTVTVEYKTDAAGITALRLDLLADPSLPANGPGRAPNGNLVLHELKVSIAPADNSAQPVPVKLAAATVDFAQASFSGEGIIDGNPGTGWALAPQMGQDHTAVVEFDQPVGAAGGSIITVVLEQNFGSQHTIGRFRVSVTNAPKPVRLDGENLPAPVAAALAIAEEQRNDEQKNVLLAYFRTLDAGYLALKADVDAVAAQAVQSRLRGAQDVAWALLNSPAFLFNH
ncbi:MAG: DUF1549 and DUF1553 domain-containing protein [Pirellulales bacterium]